MDLSKFKTHDWLVVGGGIGMLIFGFMHWIKVSYDGPLGVGISASGANAFDFFFTGTVPWLLLVAAAVVTVLLLMGTLKRDMLPWPLVILVATGLAALLLLIRFVFNPGVDTGNFDGLKVGRGIGMILSVIAGIVAAVGGVMTYTASGGNLSDLTDVNKIKGAFDKQGGGEMPPPPPPPMG
jgi:hypothetical protein